MGGLQAVKPFRLHMFFSNKYAYAQVVRVADGNVVASASTIEAATRESLKAAGVSTSCVEAAGRCGVLSRCCRSRCRLAAAAAASRWDCSRSFQHPPAFVPPPSSNPQDRGAAGAARQGGGAERRALAAAPRRALPRKDQVAADRDGGGGAAPHVRAAHWLTGTQPGKRAWQAAPLGEPGGANGWRGPTSALLPTRLCF